MATYPLPGRAARWARSVLRVALLLAVALSDVALLAPPPGARASRPEQTGGTAYQVTLKVGSGSIYPLPQGASVTLPISVSVTAAVGLASASVLVQYDPLQLRPIACDPQAGWPGGFCNIAYDPEHGLIRFNVISDTELLGEIGLFDLTFAAASTSTVRTEVPVTPLIESITDLQGNYMTSWAQGSKVKIAAASSGGAAVYVGAPKDPNPLTITRGSTTAVPIVITQVTGLGSASFSLAFDPAVVRPLECQPVQRPDADGVCALHADHVAANLLSQDGITGTAIAPVTAFVVVFTTAPTAIVGDSSPLDLTLGAFADTAGAPIPVRLINNALKVSKTASAVVPILRLDPVAQYLNDDERRTVDVFLENGAQLASGSWGIRYDPLVVQAESCEIDSNVVNAVCNPAVEPGLVRMSMLGFTEGGPPAGVPAHIGTIWFRRHPQAKAGMKSSLIFEVTNFANALDEQLSFQTHAAEITLADPLGLPAVAIRLIGTPPYLLYRGSSLDFPVNFTVDPERPIANLTGSIHYDPIVLRPTQCMLNDPTPDGPTAFCNAQYDTKQGIIRFTLFDAEGFSGSVTPFVLRFEAASTSASGNLSPLHFTVEAIGDPLGEPRTWAATDESVLIKPPVPAPRVLVGPPNVLNTMLYTVTLGSSVTVPLWVENVPDLGAGTIEVRYDPTVVRATRCTLRSDLTPTLDGGFCSLLPGVVRFAFVASQGITGIVQLYDIEFAQAPNAVGGMTTPLNVVVLNFVNTYEVPIPTTVRDGIIVISALRITKTANPTHVAETGGNVTFTFLVENIGQNNLTLTALSDDKFGVLTGDGDCHVGTVLAGGASCSFTATFAIPAGDYPGSHVNIVSATASAAGGRTDTATDEETVTYTDVLPDISVTKTADVSSVTISGGKVTFTYVVKNNSSEAAQITVLSDDKFGALTGDNRCHVGTVLAGGASCSFKATFLIPPSDSPGSHVNVFTATVADDDGNTDTATDDETVIITDTPTRVVISRFDASDQDGQVVVEWETAVESNTAGFFLYRQDPGGGQPVRVNERIVPAFLGMTRGGVYRLLDAGAQAGETYTYTLQEIASRGQSKGYGPFKVTADRLATAASALSGGAGVTYERIPRPASLEVQPARPEPNAGTDVPEALPETPGTPEDLPLHTWLPLVLQGSEATDTGENGDVSQPAVDADASAQVEAVAATGLAKLTVRTSGLYYLAASDIAPALGLSVAQVTSLIKGTGLKLTNQGQTVAYLAASGNAGIYFYAEGLQSPYTRDNVYWLQQPKGQAFGTLSGKVPAAVALTTFPASSHAEQDLLPVPGLFNDPAADYWMWDYVVAADPSAGSRSFGLQADGAAAQGSASLTARFLGLTDSGTGADHHAQIVLNGAVIGAAIWTGAVPYAVNLPVNPALLKDGANTIEVVGLLDAGVPYSIFCVNSFDVSYPRAYRALKDMLAFTSVNNQAVTVYGFSNNNVMVFDISNPKLPKRVTAVKVEASGGAYRVTFKPAAAGVPYLAVTTTAVPRITTLAADKLSALKGPNAANYVIITTAGLAQPAGTLAAYRQGQGLQAKVVDVQDIYDEFNGGAASPQAIRDFLAYAYANWNPAPKYVLLAGAGSFDYKNNLGYGDSLVPPIMAGTIDVLSAADGRYGDVTGNDGAPEIAVGRLPVLTPAEFQAHIAKMQAYEAADAAGWSRQVLMLADNTDPEAGNFPADSDFLAAGIPAEYTAQKVYLGPLSSVDARSQALAALSAGVGVFNYIGHAGLDVLAAENLLTSDDVAALNNSPKLPFMSTATCVVGDYVEPGYRSLGMLMALQGDGGAAAVFSPTGSSIHADGVALDLRLFQQLFGGTAARAGDATRAALVQYAADGGPRYALDTYNLLGDPAMEMRWR